MSNEVVAARSKGSTAGWVWMVDTRFDDDDLYLDL